jgi:hypothetical protein
MIHIIGRYFGRLQCRCESLHYHSLIVEIIIRSTSPEQFRRRLQEGTFDRYLSLALKTTMRSLLFWPKLVNIFLPRLQGFQESEIGSATKRLPSTL